MLGVTQATIACGFEKRLVARIPTKFVGKNMGVSAARVAIPSFLKQKCILTMNLRIECQR